MSWETFFENLPAYMLAAASLFTSYMIIKRGKKELKTLDADLASKYQNMLKVEQEQAIGNQREFIIMKEKIKVLEETLEEVQKTLEEYAAGVDLLLAQLKTSGITPIWKPKKRFQREEE